MSSALLEYSTKLQAMGMADNPAKSYDQVPINERLERLREHKERWQNFNWRWKTSASVPKLDYFETLKAEAGVVYIGPRDELDIRELHSTTLPSSKDQTVDWCTFRLEAQNASIAAYTLSIEENDLLACVTYHQSSSTTNSYTIQVHLVQHSTQLPYPGLSSSTLEVSRLECREDQYPVVNLAIRGTNMVVMVGSSALQEAESPTEFNWTGHLSFWNWRTGEKKAEKKNIPDKHKGLIFLREDVLVHGRSLDLCLDIYHIPVSTSSAGDNDIRLIGQLGLPKIKKEFKDELLYDIDISFGNNPTSVTSFTECFSPKLTKMFTTDSINSIMAIDLLIGDRQQMAQHFTFVTHYRTLLDRADAAINCHEKGLEEGAASSLVSWEDWGPDATRMFFWNARYSNAQAASCGTRYFVQTKDEMEVFDFCQVGREDNRGQQKDNGPNENQKPSDLRPFAEQGDDPSCQGDCLQVIHTKLPFVSQTFENKVQGGKWDVMYVDQSRIVRLKVIDRFVVDVPVLQEEEIEVIYLG